MELYIENGFLEKFNSLSSKKIKSKTNSIVKNLFNNYGNTNYYLDTELKTTQDFEKIKPNHLRFNYVGPETVNSIEQHLFDKSNFNQTLVFMRNEMAWFKKAEDKGALCFSFDNYQDKIREIIKQLHFKIDLSENFSGWDFLKCFSTINFNSLVISDGYILKDIDGQKIADNIIPILQNIISHKDRATEVKIFTKDLNPLSETYDHKKEKAKKRHNIINSIFEKFKTKFVIVLYLKDISINFKFHDRYIATNFSLMDCGVGFNLVPHKKADSQIISETIFDYYTYKRLNNLTNIQTKYIEKLKETESLSFKMYP